MRRLPSRDERRVSPLGAFCLLFLAIAAVRLSMVLLLAPAIPFYDEWDGVVAAMAKPLRAGVFDPAYLFASQNGHPLLWTKLTSLLFLLAQGQHFDNVPVCLFSQLVYAFAAALLIHGASTRLGEDGRWFAVVAALVLIVPFDWENVTMGWGNLYLFASLFGVGLLVACAYSDGRLRGLLGIAALGGAATLSLGSGLVAPAIGAAILIWRATQREIEMRRAVAVACVLIAWALLGFAIGRTTHVDGQDAPLGPVHAAELALLTLLWLPAWIHAARYLRGERSAFALVVIAVAGWAFVQIVAMILLRPLHFRLWLPISRYMDIIAVGALAVLASISLVARGRRGLPFGLPAASARAALIAAALATVLASPLAFGWQWRWAAYHRDQEKLIRAYLASHDGSLLRDATPTSLPYPDAARLQQMLDDPDIVGSIAPALERRQ